VLRQTVPSTGSGYRKGPIADGIGICVTVILLLEKSVIHSVFETVGGKQTKIAAGK